VDNPPSFDVTEIEECLRAADAADYPERLVDAIRDRRLCGFMMQEQAESTVGKGDWIEKTLEGVIAEATAENANVGLPDLKFFRGRHDG
jgi:hypothetical protein